MVGSTRPIMDLLSESLQAQVIHFSKTKYQSMIVHVPILLLFIGKYSVIWILKWQYHLTSPIKIITAQSSAELRNAFISQVSQFDVATRHYFIKWWDKFKVERIIDQVQKEFHISLFPNQTPIASTATPTVKNIIT